jgi:transcriptional regulator with XRE-family HTH domain
MHDDSEVDLATSERIRMLRRRRGLTQEEAAGLAGVSVSLWRKWESGARAVGRFRQLMAIARALRVTDLRDLTGQPLAATPRGHPRHEAADAVRLALVRHQGLLAPVDPPDLDRLERGIEQAYDAAHSPGPWRYAHVGAVLPDLIATGDRAIRRYDGAELARAVRPTVMIYMLARAWLKWVGEYDLVLLAAERGLAVAERGNDAGLYGAAAWSMAQGLSCRAEIAESRTVAADAMAMLAADTASDHAPQELLSAWGALHLVAMIGAAREDDQREGRHLLNGAAKAAARLGEDRNDYRLVFGPTNVGIHQVAYAVELGQSRSAVAGARVLDVSRTPSVERRVSLRLDVAQSHTRLREDVAALQSLAAAAEESPEQVRYSVTARAMLREMLRRENSDTRPLLRPLAERVGVLT